MAGVKAGQLHQGHFNADQFNYLEVNNLHSGHANIRELIFELTGKRICSSLCQACATYRTGEHEQSCSR